MFNKIDAMNLIFVIIIHIKASYSSVQNQLTLMGVLSNFGGGSNLIGVVLEDDAGAATKFLPALFTHLESILKVFTHLASS